MSPIVKWGYRSPQDKAELQAFYNSQGWKQTRALVKARAGGLCEWCGEAKPLDCVHLEGRTLELLRQGGDVLNPGALAAGCRRCHSQYAAGLIGRPPGR